MQRVEGDGMDSEVLMLQDLRSGGLRGPIIQPPVPASTKYRNMATPERTTTVVKTAAKFIPHEPVKVVYFFSLTKAY